MIAKASNQQIFSFNHDFSPVTNLHFLQKPLRLRFIAITCYRLYSLQRGVHLAPLFVNLLVRLDGLD